MLITEGMGEDMADDIGGQEIGGCKDALRCIPLACMLLIHSLYIVDDIFELINILYFNYFLQKM
jgi:hypothetical protein